MKPTLLTMLAATTLLLAACYTNPITGRKSIVLLSQGEEVTLGQQSFADIRTREKASSDPGLNARANRIGQRIAQAVGQDLPDAKWEFVVFDSPDLNAFALPGGKVGVYTGLMQLAENDAELATVIAHEIGHVIARHGAERMSEALLIAGLGEVTGQIVEAKTTAGSARSSTRPMAGWRPLGGFCPIREPTRVRLTAWVSSMPRAPAMTQGRRLRSGKRCLRRKRRRIAPLRLQEQWGLSCRRIRRMKSGSRT